MDELLKLITALAMHPTALTDATAFGSAVGTVVQHIAKGEGGADKVKAVASALAAAAASADKVAQDIAGAL